MVARRYILILCGLLAMTATAWAQSFPTGDTVTEYPHKGTFYHDRFEGRKTANGEIFDQNLFTAAHWRIKLGTMVMVTNQNTGLQVIVRINDRCPRHGVLDMTHRAATAIGIRGCQPVTVRILPEGYEEQWLAQDQLFDSVYSRLTGTENASRQPVLPPLPTPSTSRHNAYNISLCTITSHTEAFEQIQKLPPSYQDKVVIQPANETEKMNLILEAQLPKDQAEVVLRQVKEIFPNSRLAPHF